MRLIVLIATLFFIVPSAEGLKTTPCDPADPADAGKPIHRCATGPGTILPATFAKPRPKPIRRGR